MSSSGSTHYTTGNHGATKHWSVLQYCAGVRCGRGLSDTGDGVTMLYFEWRQRDMVSKTKRNVCSAVSELLHAAESRRAVQQLLVHIHGSRHMYCGGGD